MRTRAWVVATVLALLVGLPTVLSAQCPDGSPPPCGRRAPLDTARYAILPFAHREGGQQSTLDGADCAELLSEGFARWMEVRLADKTRVYDALARHGARVPFRIPFDTAVAIARRLGAGKLVMGQLWSFGDTLRLTAGVYDAARGGAPLREVTTRVPANGGIGEAFNALADSLLGADPGTAQGAGAAQTRSLRALRAYALGERAMRQWDLARAASAFREAVAADSGFAHAYLGLGQALLWAADSSADAARDRNIIARRTGTLLGNLGNSEGVLLRAQQAMFEQRWPDACRLYREMLAADSTSFTAWYGLAECNAGDRAVVRYPPDTTRWTFRGSYELAVQAYRRALLLTPAFNLTFGPSAIARLPKLLLAERWYLRQGSHDDAPYYAFPELEADTMAFYAVPAALAAVIDIEPRAHVAAVERNRRILLEVATSFLSAFPREPRAHRTLARALEVMGRLVLEVGAPGGALTELATAQQLEPDPYQRAQDAADRVRVLVKAGELGAARRLGDSLLQAAPRPCAGVAGVAVLLGRPTLATSFLAIGDTTWLATSADNQPAPMPLEAARAGLALLAYSAAGAPGDSIAAYERRIEDLLASVPPSRRPTLRSALLDRPAELVFDALGLRPAHRVQPPGPHEAMRLQWSLAHGDTTLVRIALDSLARGGGGSLATGESIPDGVYVDARLLLAVGDTATAVRTLDAPLDSLVALHTATLRFLPIAGSLVRMMALRANLAVARGEEQTARRWARAVVTLWSGAEPALRPTITAMNRILAPAR